MQVFARINHIRWVHLWTSAEAYEAGEASVHFLDSRIDPRWRELVLPEEARRRLEAGELVALEDPGWLDPGDDA
jgi:hypothetical protein